MGIYGKYFSVIFAFIVVLILLLFTTKYLAYKSKKMLKGNYMQIVESLSLGVNNRLHLIKVDKEFIIISATNKNVEFLARVNINDYEEEELINPLSEVIDFKSLLKKSINGSNFKNQARRESEVKADDILKQKPTGTDEIQNSNITFKENLEKLKHLTKTINGKRSENEQEK